MRMFRIKKHQESGRVETPTVRRTPYRYGGSLGWLASMLDPETSSWKPMSLKRQRESASPGARPRPRPRI